MHWEQNKKTNQRHKIDCIRTGLLRMRFAARSRSYLAIACAFFFLKTGLFLAMSGCGSKTATMEAQPEAKSTDTTPSQKRVEAEKLFADLGKELEVLAGQKEPVDIDWLEQELQKVLSLDSNHAAAQFNLAMVFQGRGQADKANDLIQAIAKDHPKFVPAQENMAATYVTSGDIGKAKRVYKKLIQADPKVLTSRLALAKLLQNEGKHQEAIDLCRKVLQRKADAIEAFRILAQSYFAVGDDAMAELIVGRGLKVDPKDPYLHHVTAEILLAKNDLAGTVAKLKQVIRLKPDWLEPRAQFAEIALAYNDFGNAAQQYEAILKAVPNNRSAKLGLAMSYKGTGRYEQAEQLLNALLNNDANDVDALWNLAMLHWLHTKEYDKSIQLLKRFEKAAPRKDKDANRVARLITNIDTEKKDVAARRAREEKERNRKQAIAAACKAVANNQVPNAEAIGTDQERIQAAWDLLLVTAVQNIEGGQMLEGENAARCALEIVPLSPGVGLVTCAQIRVKWVQMQYQIGMLATSASLRDAKAIMEKAVECDPDNPDAQLFVEQLEALALQAEQAEAQATPEPAPVSEQSGAAPSPPAQTP